MRPNRFVPILVLILALGLGALVYNLEDVGVQPDPSTTEDEMTNEVTIGNESIPTEAITALNIELDKQRLKTEAMENQLAERDADTRQSVTDQREKRREIDELTLVISKLQEEMKQNSPRILARELQSLQRELSETTARKETARQDAMTQDYSGEMPKNETNQVALKNGLIMVTPLVASTDTHLDDEFAKLNASEVIIGAERDPLSLQRAEGDAAVGFTIPLAGTGLNGIAATALIGKVPNGGRIENPFQFKVLLGDDMLAANEQHLSGLAKTVLTGVAEGDPTLSCVRGRVTGLLFVFHDGSIYTAVGSETDPLAYLTDPYGDCIAGRLLSNRTPAAAMSLLAESVRLAGEAYAESQTTQRQFSDGTVDTIVTGDDEDYLIGRIGQGAGDAVAGVINARTQALIDLIHVPAGSKVTVHFLKNIPVDHSNRLRQLQYSMSTRQDRSLP